MLILSEQEIKDHYFMNDAIYDVKQGLISKKKGQITNPHRTVIDIPAHQASSLYMPSADLSQEIASVKLVSIFPENPKQGKPTTQGALVLTDASNGEHICMMSASFLTRLRTGALSGIGTEKLARTDAQTLGVIGTGAMAFEQVLGVLEVRDIQELILFNRTIEKAYTFKEALMTWGITIPIKVVDSPKQVMQVSDIIACSTRSDNPVFDGNDLRPGMHINGVGSYLPSMREVDLKTIQTVDKIIVDDLASIKEEAGELIYANQESDWQFSHIHAELSDVGGGDRLLRETDQEITFFKSVGAAYFDLVVAKGIYVKAKSLGIGQKIEL
ncbi:ornithine cyclodeaminase family protein [Virgibacillus salexigens]|uniref:Ornithine cyclodeaminase n=1 Tax=Virgibacillus massiliensis TaxID=1462526 RepID=A0A024Q9Y7_9BACI|nr:MULTISPECIES: ornithine cyclodeaminase [Virgibacillus]CDQ38766.1 ornithine cyclodeaminase [Virgibacillus massiliensis]